MRQSNTVVVGVGNVPVEVKGLSQPLSLQWDNVEGQCQLMVLTTLTDVDVILGMDILSQFGIKANCREQTASPTQECCTSLILEENVIIPTGKSRIFLVRNILTGLTLFEPGINLPEGLLGVPALGQGSKLAIQMDNLSEKDIVLNPKWDIGQLYTVQLTDPPKAGHLPEVPGTLDQNQQTALNKLLGEYKDVFSKEGDPISSTSLVEHEIYTEGPPVRNTIPSTESFNQGTGTEPSKGDVEGWSHSFLHKSMGFSCGYGQKEGRINEVLCRFPEGK